MNDDFESLVNNARRDVAHKAASNLTDVNKTSSGEKQLILGVFLFIVFISLVIYSTFPTILTNNNHQDDNKEMLRDADEIIMDYYYERNQLPAQIPDPTLALFVKYQIFDATASPPLFSLAINTRKN